MYQVVNASIVLLTLSSVIYLVGGIL